MSYQSNAVYLKIMKNGKKKLLIVFSAPGTNPQSAQLLLNEGDKVWMQNTTKQSPNP